MGPRLERIATSWEWVSRPPVAAALTGSGGVETATLPHSPGHKQRRINLNLQADIRPEKD